MWVFLIQGTCPSFIHNSVQLTRPVYTNDWKGREQGSPGIVRKQWFMASWKNIPLVLQSLKLKPRGVDWFSSGMSSAEQKSGRLDRVSLKSRHERDMIWVDSVPRKTRKPVNKLFVGVAWSIWQPQGPCETKLPFLETTK